MNQKPDYSTYTESELVSTLETIDDREFPERALEIYDCLSKALQVKSDTIDSRYTEDGFLGELVDFVLSVTVSGLQPAKADMREKLTRIRENQKSIRT